jgi:hypothetical protein
MASVMCLYLVTQGEDTLEYTILLMSSVSGVHYSQLVDHCVI